MTQLDTPTSPAATTRAGASADPRFGELVTNDSATRLRSILAFGGIAAIFILFTGWFWKLQHSWYFWDEWDYLRRIRADQYDVIAAHNEHFIPIFNALYLLEFKLFGLDSMSFHLVNLGVHGLASIAVGWMIATLVRSNWIGAAAAVVFACHPLQWQNVLWTFQTQIMMSVALGAIAIGMLERAASSADSGQRRRWFWSAVVVSALPAWSFGSGLAFPWIAAAFMLIRFPVSWRRRSLLVLPFAAVSLVNVMTYQLFAGSDTVRARPGFHDLDIVSGFFVEGMYRNAYRALSTSANHDPSWTPAVLVVSVFIIALTTVVVRGSRRERELITFAVGQYVAVWLMLTAGRWMYGPSAAFEPRYGYLFIAPIALLSAIIAVHAHRSMSPRARLAVPVVVMLVLGLFMVRAIDYRNGIVSAQSALFLHNRQAVERARIGEWDAELIDTMHPYIPATETAQIVDQMGVPADPALANAPDVPVCSDCQRGVWHQTP